MEEKTKMALRRIPKIDEVLLVLEGEEAWKGFPRHMLVDACRRAVGDVRKAILGGVVAEKSAVDVAEEVKKKLTSYRSFSLRRLVNATGIVLHTNLGRAPLCEEAIERIIEVSRGYSNLEFDLAAGKRGIRYDHVTDILCALTGAEDALIVNNNAAAVLLVLNTLSQGREAIVSRGELIEIGGEFRIPEVMEKSGAILREVGTTNRTHLSDYEHAIQERTGVILKVHTSNFRTVGFTEEIGLKSLVELGFRHGVPVMNDLGSGCFVELEQFGFEREPTVQAALQSGVDVVTFSGDKLLGGPQAGVILGKRDIIGAVKKNPLNRALRIDKLTLAALEGTVKAYLDERGGYERLRVLRSLTEPLTAVRERARKLLDRLRSLSMKDFTFTLKEGKSLAGGGSLPTQEIPTALIAVTSKSLSASGMEKRFRALDVPIIARIHEDEILLDLRTIEEEEFPFIETGLGSIAGRKR